MLITEEDARQKFCPHMRVIGSGDGSANRWHHDDFDKLAAIQDGNGNRAMNACLGSACMQWRKAETAEFKMNAEAEFRKSGRRLESTTGFCGLAGSPVR